MKQHCTVIDTVREEAVSTYQMRELRRAMKIMKAEARMKTPFLRAS